MTHVGKPVLRQEDFRFVTGRGSFVDDVVLAGTTYAAFVRSPHAHARVIGIKKENALSFDGVLAVLTGEDWVRNKLGTLLRLSRLRLATVAQ